MDKNINSESSDLALAKEMMGDEETEEKTSEAESKAETETNSEEEKEEVKTEEETKDEDNDEEKSAESSPTKSEDKDKEDKVAKAIFSQLKEIRQDNKELREEIAKVKEVKPIEKQSEKQQEVADNVRAFSKKIAEKQGLDEEGISELVAGIVELTKQETATLPKDVQEKLKLLDDLADREKKAKDIETFEGEWNTLLPQLKKEYPNANESLLKEAKKYLDNIAHSEKGGVKINNSEIKGYPLDYILYQNKKAIDTLLKVSKGKSGESGTQRDVLEEGEEQDINLDPEEMTPETYKKYMKREVKRHTPEDIKIYN